MRGYDPGDRVKEGGTGPSTLAEMDRPERKLETGEQSEREENFKLGEQSLIPHPDESF